MGAEIPFNAQPPLTLLARDRAAYGLLCRILTASHTGRPKGQPALEWSEFLKLLERPESEGLIALLPEEWGPGTDGLITLRDFFPDRLFQALIRALDGKDAQRTGRALAMRRELGIPIVATNDVHYHVRERRMLQDVVTSIREGTPLSQAGTRLFPNAERYLKSPDEMRELFQDLPEAIENTVKIADLCTFSPSELRYRYPSEWLPKGESAQGYLARLVLEGERRRYPGGTPDDVQRQIKHELELIDKMRFADYFLTIWEITDFARKQDILFQGRGSAANSVVCYCLGITAIDPIRMNLLFERFISVERGEPPDIDVDFENGDVKKSSSIFTKNTDAIAPPWFRP